MVQIITSLDITFATEFIFPIDSCKASVWGHKKIIYYKFDLDAQVEFALRNRNIGMQC